MSANAAANVLSNLAVPALSASKAARISTKAWDSGSSTFLIDSEFDSLYWNSAILRPRRDISAKKNEKII